MAFSTVGESQQTPLVNWDEVKIFTSLVSNTNPVFAVFPPTQGPCIHRPCDLLGEIPKDLIESDLRSNPHHSLGMVINPAKDQPLDWGTKPEHLNKNGHQKKWGASNDHIDHANCIWVEGDGGLSPEEQLSVITDAFEPLPSYVLLTGGKSVHAYWMLTDPIAPEGFKDLMQRLPAQLNKHNPAYGADTGLHNPCRVMRVPGGFHPKTGERCQLISASSLKYSASLLEGYLEPKPNTPKQQSGLFKKGRFADEGWFNRLPKEQQHITAVEMLGFVPKREQEGKGERKTCISILFALLGKFDEKETAQICDEAGWSSEFWDPIKEIPTCYEPSNSIGTLVHHARQGGWVHPDDRAKIKLEMLFPPDLVEALRVVTKYFPYPDYLVATTYLAGLSGVLRLGSRINLFPGSDFVVPLNLYVATVGKTGSKKSPLQRALIDSPLEDIKGELRKGWQQMLGDWLKRKANDDEDAGPRPEQPLLIVKDITGEALEQQLEIQEKQQLGLLLCRDELAGVFKGFGRYTQGRGSEQEQLLELYDGGGFSTLRKKELRFCEKTHLSVYGGIQPEVLADLQQGKDPNGQWARFLFSPLFAKPTRLATRFPASEQKKFERAKRKLKEVVRRVRDIPAFEHQVSNEFLEAFAEYEYGKQCKAEEAKRPSHAAILNKSAGKVGRVAGLLHLIHLPGSPETPENMGRVGVERLEAAIALVDYLDNYAMKFQTQSTRSELAKWMKRLHLIAAKAKSPMAWSDIQKHLSGTERTVLTKELKDQAFGQLEEAGLGELSKGPQGGLKYKAILPWPDDA